MKDWSASQGVGLPLFIAGLHSPACSWFLGCFPQPYFKVTVEDSLKQLAVFQDFCQSPLKGLQPLLMGFSGPQTGRWVWSVNEPSSSVHHSVHALATNWTLFSPIGPIPTIQFWSCYIIQEEKISVVWRSDLILGQPQPYPAIATLGILRRSGQRTPLPCRSQK